MLVDIIRAAVLRAEGSSLAEGVSGDAQINREMLDLSNEVAADISKSHGWQALTKIGLLTADGVSEAYPMPEDYDRMAGDGSWFWGLSPLGGIDDYMDAIQGGHPGGWFILGGMIHFAPLQSGVTRFPYISSYYAIADGGERKARFTSDDDNFVLDDRLLTLGLVWRWKAQKGMNYTEDMATFEIALAQEQARDRGPYVLKPPRQYRGLNRWNTTPFPAAPGPVIGAPGSGVDTDYVAIYEASKL